MTKLVAKGDRTTTGGEMLGGSSTQYDDDGRPLALDMDGANCGICKGGPFPVLGSVSDWLEEGRNLVKDLDPIACPCRKNFVLARGQSYFIEVGGRAATSPASISPTQKAGAGQADEQVRIVDESGCPVPNCPFHIRDAAGKTYQGLSDENGLCPRVYTDRQQRLDIAVGLQALQRWEA